MDCKTVVWSFLPILHFFSIRIILLNGCRINPDILSSIFDDLIEINGLPCIIYFMYLHYLGYITK